MKNLKVLIVLLISSCQQVTVDLTDAEKLIVTKEVSHMLDNYYADINKDGLTAELNYLDNTPNFFWVPPGYRQAISYDSVVSILRQHAPSLSIYNVWDTLRVIPLTRELASYTGRLRSSMTDTLGITSQHTLVETGLLIKRKGEWKLLSGQTSILN